LVCCAETCFVACRWRITANSDPGVLQQQALAASGKEGTKKSVEELRELAKRRAKVREVGE
jgi:hypothetical protein